MIAVHRQLKSQLKSCFERMAGFHLVKASRHGHSELLDMQRACPTIECILDIGANVGTMTVAFKRYFSDARVFSFEPVPSTFSELDANTAHLPGVTCCCAAMGGAVGQAQIFLTEDSSGSTLVRPNNFRKAVDVEVMTVDSFAEKHGLKRIDILKSDTEGYEMEVLVGAREVLAAERVRFVLVECGFHPGDRRHTLFDELRDYLLPLGFRVFGFYDQQLEWSGEKSLRFANVTFCNEAALRE